MTAADQQVSPASLETIVFGGPCHWCQREEPCLCGPLHGRDKWGRSLRCECTCGRCQFDGPLSDDGPLPIGETPA